MFSFIYQTIFYKPLLNGLVLLIKIIPGGDMGIAVIILTLIVRTIIFPFNHKSLMAQKKIKAIEPELKDIKKNVKDQKEQARMIMELYKQHGINPLSSFVTLLIQIPLIWALYKVFLAGIAFNTAGFYSFVSAPEIVNLNFLGIIEMTKASTVLAFLAGITQFFQIRLSLPAVKEPDNKKEKTFKDDLMKSMGVQMRYVMPVFVFLIGLKLSAAVALYWTTMNIFAIVHEIIIKKKAEKISVNQSIKRYEKRSGNNQIIDQPSLGENDSQR
jgi:YidC/Oxa1 family membrane protein insertase